MSSLVLALVATATLSGAQTATISAPQPNLSPLYAVVVGNNHPLPGSDYAVLRYADDDALRFATYFEQLGAKVFLLTGPDAESAAHFGPLADRARSPTKAMLQATLEELRVKLETEVDKNPEVFFYFSGHGTISSADAYLHLLDEPLSRSDLQRLVLRALPTFRTHIIIDSCHSYFLVNARGERVPAAIEGSMLERHPNAGFLLSTSADVEVQEWSGYQSGVFSYQVLSALQGAADVDLDGAVTYAEMEAYLVAANLDVQNTSARIRPYVRRPNIRGRVLLDLRRVPTKRWLALPEDLSGHIHVANGSGRRILDAHKAGGTALNLVPMSDQDLYVFAEKETFAIEQTQRYMQLGLRITEADRTTAARGPIADALRQSLFSRPLTAEFVAGVEAMQDRAIGVQLDPRQVPSTAWHEDGLTIGLFGASGAGAVFGGVGAVLFSQARNEANRRPVTADSEAARGRAEDFRALMIGGFSVAGALLSVGLLRAIFTNDALEQEPQ